MKSKRPCADIQKCMEKKMAVYQPHSKLSSWYVPFPLFSLWKEEEIRLTNQIGWKPGPNAPKPLERGSAQTNLKDILS